MTERNAHPLYGKNRTSHRSWRAIRTWARRNMDPICHICNGEIDLTISNYRLPEAWTLDHVIPVALGGTNDRNNLKPAHRGCNSRKGDGTTRASRTFTQAQEVTTTDRLFPVQTRHSPNWVPPEHRPGPYATDRRAFVYGPTPDFPVILDCKGERHLRSWDDTEISWKPGQPWPPKLSDGGTHAQVSTVEVAVG